MKIERIKTGSWGKVLAYLDVRTTDGFVIKGFRLVSGSKGLFVSAPSKKGSDGNWYDDVTIDDDVRGDLLTLAKEAYEADTGGKVAGTPPAGVPDEKAYGYDDDIPF